MGRWVQQEKEWKRNLIRLSIVEKMNGNNDSKS